MFLIFNDGLLNWALQSGHKLITAHQGFIPMQLVIHPLKPMLFQFIWFSKSVSCLSHIYGWAIGYHFKLI